MSNATFVLMNCDLIAVPLQLGAGVVTVYCGVQRANQLLDLYDNGSPKVTSPTIGLGSVARRLGSASRNGYSGA